MEKHLGVPKADPLKPRWPSLQSLETCWRKYRCGKSVWCYSCCWYLVGYIGCGKVIKVSGKEMVAGSTKELKEISAEKFTQKKDKAKMARRRWPIRRCGSRPIEAACGRLRKTPWLRSDTHGNWAAYRRSGWCDLDR